jgi:hypothetical protein
MKDEGKKVMKSIILELNDDIYPKVIEFLRLPPPEQCHLLEDEAGLTEAERSEISSIREKANSGDMSDFESWSEARKKF